MTRTCPSSRGPLHIAEGDGPLFDGTAHAGMPWSKCCKLGLTHCRTPSQTSPRPTPPRACSPTPSRSSPRGRVPGLGHVLEDCRGQGRAARPISSTKTSVDERSSEERSAISAPNADLPSVGMSALADEGDYLVRDCWGPARVRGSQTSTARPVSRMNIYPTAISTR